jgi:Sigma-70, region 4
VARPLKHAMTLEQIAAAEGTSLRTINSAMSRAMRKLRRAGLLQTARELSIELEHNRGDAHSLSRPRSAKKGGSA